MMEPTVPTAPTDRPAATQARATPVLVALAAVAVLLVGNAVVDVILARRVAAETATVVENTQRSIELVDDLRTQVHLLSDRESSAAEVGVIARRIAADVQAFDALAYDPGEREEWLRLVDLLGRVQQAVDARQPGELPSLVHELSSVMDRLVVVNRRAADAASRKIRRTHQSAFYTDVVAGVVALGLLAIVGALMVVALRRERALVARQIELLDERNRELDAFAGRAAHDLRGPLQPIRGYAELLMTDEECTPDARAMAARIRQGVDKLSSVIDDMLELSRAGHPPPGEADLRDAVDEVLSAHEVELRGAEVKADCPSVRVACAPGVLSQVLRNVVTNATKFRSHTRPLTLSLNGVVDGGSVVLRVVDNGVGMDEESAARAFEPHFRGRADRESPGHGLGLAIVARAVRAVGGEVALASAPDAGTTITISLPLARGTGG
jgi:signal transduction histidine kinase